MNCNFSVKIFENRSDLADNLTDQLFQFIMEKTNKGEFVNIAVSGGSTPAFFYKRVCSRAKKEDISLASVNIFWVDERCSAPSSAESNFRLLYETLIDPLDLPFENIFRIRGEDDPETEAERYSRILDEKLPKKDNLPAFDWIFLGVGADGHTASIFPESLLLGETKLFAAVAESPETGRKRVTLTLPVINNADQITFIVTGAGKRDIVRKLCRLEEENPLYPASYIKTQTGSVSWYIDNEAWSSWTQDCDDSD